MIINLKKFKANSKVIYEAFKKNLDEVSMIRLYQCDNNLVIQGKCQTLCFKILVPNLDDKEDDFSCAMTAEEFERFFKSKKSINKDLKLCLNGTHLDVSILEQKEVESFACVKTKAPRVKKESLFETEIFFVKDLIQFQGLIKSLTKLSHLTFSNLCLCEEKKNQLVFTASDSISTHRLSIPLKKTYDGAKKLPLNLLPYLKKLYPVLELDMTIEGLEQGIIFKTSNLEVFMPYSEGQFPDLDFIFHSTKLRSSQFTKIEVDSFIHSIYKEKDESKVAHLYSYKEDSGNEIELEAILDKTEKAVALMNFETNKIGSVYPFALFDEIRIKANDVFVEFKLLQDIVKIMDSGTYSQLENGTILIEKGLQQSILCPLQ